MIMYRKINKKKILYVEINLNLFDRISFFFFFVYVVSRVDWFSFFSSRIVS